MVQPQTLYVATTTTTITTTTTMTTMAAAATQTAAAATRNKIKYLTQLPPLDINFYLAILWD